MFVTEDRGRDKVNGDRLCSGPQGARIDEPLAELRSGTSSYYDQDGVGSVTSLSNGTGAVTNSYVYDTFGNSTVSTGSIANPFQYTGRDYDPETGLRYYRARYYDATAGRFIAEDPIGFDAERIFIPTFATAQQIWLTHLDWRSAFTRFRPTR